MKNKKDIMCYHICTTDKENPYLLSLDSRHISKKTGDIQHMKNGFHDGDFRFTIRETATKFICVDTLEVFNITERGSFTVKAWGDFISSYKK